MLILIFYFLLFILFSKSRSRSCRFQTTFIAIVTAFSITQNLVISALFEANIYTLRSTFDYWVRFSLKFTRLSFKSRNAIAFAFEALASLVTIIFANFTSTIFSHEIKIANTLSRMCAFSVPRAIILALSILAHYSIISFQTDTFSRRKVTRTMRGIAVPGASSHRAVFSEES